MKKLVCLLISAFLTISIGGAVVASAVDTPAPQDLKVGVVMKSFDEFQNAVIAGVIDEAVKFGAKKENVLALAPKNESDLEGQVKMIENCVAQGVNILILSAQHPDIVNAPLANASAQGIKIVLADTDAPKFNDPNKVTYIGTDNYIAAHDGAVEFIKRYLKSGNGVVILRGKYGDTNHDARSRGLEDACKEGGIDVLEVQDANCEAEKAASIMENLITKYGDKIKGLLVTSDNMSVGAITSIKAVNMIDKVAVCGFDGFQVSIQCVADGTEKMIIAQKPYWMGQEAFKAGAAALYKGETFPAYINPGISIIDDSNYKEFLN